MGEIRRAIAFYLTFWKGYRRHIWVMGLLYTVKHGAWMAFPLLIKIIVDTWIPEKRMDLIFGTIGMVAALALVNVLCHSRFKVLEADLVKNVSRELRQKLVHKLQILSLQYHHQGESGRFYSKLMMDVERCERFASFLLNGLLGSFFTLLYAVGILAVVDGRILLVYVVAIPLYLLIYRLFKNRFTKLQHEARMAHEDLSQTINHFIQTSPLARMYGEENYEREKVNRRGLAVVERQKGISREIGVFQVLTSSLGQLFLITIIALCAAAIILGRMTVGSLLLFLQYGSQIIHTLQGLLDQFPIFTEFTESITSIQEVLESPDEEPNEGKKILGKLNGDITFEKVGFAYGATAPTIFSNLDLHIPTGTSLGLVGSSGSGKTTFINLALGLLRAREGKVRLDGEDLATLDMRSVRQQVGVVTQDPILFRGTVYENIAYARESFSKEQVVEAARMANAHEFILGLEKGYDTMVGERGVTLSGGQKQRLVIARAILRRPSLLVLDEATSALDSESEREVQKGIDRLIGRQTTIIIAHRLTTLFRCDRILVFQDGRIVESGSHRELVAARGLYAGFLASQFGLAPETLDFLKGV